MEDKKAPPITISKRKKSSLEVLEAGLRQARAAIKEPTNWDSQKDANFVPMGPMYLNATAFQR